MHIVPLKNSDGKPRLGKAGEFFRKDFSIAGFLTGPNLAEIFPYTTASDFQTSFREFLGYFVKQFWPGVSTQIDKLPLTRLDYPLLVFPFFLLAALGLFYFWQSPSWRRALAAAVPAGLLAYVYFHTWAYWMAALIILSLYTLAFLRHDRERIKGMGFLWLTIAVLSVPYALNFYRFSSLPDHGDFILRLSVSEGREVALVGLGYDYLAYLLLAAAVFAFYRKRDPLRAALLLSFIAAMAVMWNVQLLTGFVPAPDHWSKAVSPMLFVILAIMLHDLLERLSVNRPSVMALVGIALIVLPALAVVKKGVNVSSLSRGLQPWVWGKYAFPTEIVASWEWINANLGREPRMITAAPMSAQYLAVYTAARPYLPQGILSPLAMSEIETRFLTASRLFEVPEPVLAAALAGQAPQTPCREPWCYYRQENFGKFNDDLYACFFSRGTVDTNQRRGCGRLSEDYRAGLLRRYRATRATWSDVPAEYVYVGPWERQFGQHDFGRDPHLTLRYQNPLVAIYEIQRP